MADIDRKTHDSGKLWLMNTNSTSFTNFSGFDPAWVTAAVNSLKISNSQIQAGNLQLKNQEGTAVGRLYVDGDMIKFEGNFDESAREFLRTVNLEYQDNVVLAQAAACRDERRRCLNLIDTWAENPFALVTDLIKQIKDNI